MTYQESERLLVGTVVMWDGNRDDMGTVRKVTPAGVYIDWANGQRGWIDHRDMGKVEIR